jgi:hypothetical protein
LDIVEKTFDGEACGYDLAGNFGQGNAGGSNA